MALIAMLAMFVVATFGGLMGNELYAKGGTPPSIAGAFPVCLFYFFRRIASLFMIYYSGVCIVYAQTEDDGLKSSAVTAYLD